MKKIIISKRKKEIEMLEIYEKFISDLELPGDVIESLETPRTHEEMRVFTLSLPRLTHPDTYILAGRLYIYLNTITAPRSISDYVEIANGMLRPEIASFLMENEGILDSLLEETWYKNFEDHNILSASKCIDYLLHVSKDDPPIETPCQLALRQAVQFHHDENIEKVIKVYREIINQEYVHASPTMFNAGLRKNQLSSCFLLHLGDNLEDLLYTGAGDVGMISKLQGGIGLSMNQVRHSAISNTGKSSGVLPFARIYDATIRCVDQGGKRNGAATISLNDWHIDAEDFIRARDNYTRDGIRLVQANTALFVSSLFMRRVRKGEKWTLFCPAKAQIGDERLVGLRGDKFEDLYLRLEEEVVRREQLLADINKKIEEVEIEAFSPDATEDTVKKLNLLNRHRVKVRKNMIDYKVVDARKMYELICDMQVKSSFPYVVYADTMNYKNNTMNIGPTESSNLCVTPETLILTDKGQLPIGELEDKKVNVWNGKEFSEVIVRKTGENQEIIKVVMEDEKFIECTPYHKFYIQPDNREVRACDLTPEMDLVEVDYPDGFSQGSTKIREVISTGRTSNTYCFNEPKRHMGIFNGIPGGNCLEITLPASPTQIASCNLGHLNLSRFVNKKDKTYDYNWLGRATQSVVDNIDKVVTYNYYPLDERDEKGDVIKMGKIHKPNIENRPLGIGVSGLAEAFADMRYSYDSPEATEMNKKIFACMYFNALYHSWELAKEKGEYATFRTGKCRLFVDGEFKEFEGSPLSNGFFQFDLWRSEAEYLDSIGELQKDIYLPEDDKPVDPSEWGNTLPIKSWDELRELIKRDGVRNSMLLALMPTASSAQMLRNAETTEAHQTLIYSRKLVHGNYMAFSEPFLYDMYRMGLLNKKMIDFINISNGTIKDIHFFISQNPDFFPNLPWKEMASPEGDMVKRLPKEYLDKVMEMQKIHKGMFEISQKVTAKMARQRGIYVDQSQSFNIYIDEPSVKKLQAVHLYTDALRLKTGMYYLRANSAIQTGRFTVDLDVQKYHSEIDDRRTKYVCSQEECLMCS